jgi:hypothetical protein
MEDSNGSVIFDDGAGDDGADLRSPLLLFVGSCDGDFADGGAGNEVLLMVSASLFSIRDRVCVYSDWPELTNIDEQRKRTNEEITITVRRFFCQNNCSTSLTYVDIANRRWDGIISPKRWER